MRVGKITFTPNPNMVTAAIGQVECTGSVTAVSVAFVASSLDSGKTPQEAVRDCPLRVDLLGLLPATAYATTVTIWGREGGSLTVPGPLVVTDSLPADLPLPSARSIGVHEGGLTALSIMDPAELLTKGAAVIVDPAGWVRWYLQSNRLIGDLEPQSGGRYTASITAYEPLAFAVLGYTEAEYHELDAAGNFQRKWTTTGGFFTDGHEVRLTSRGTAVLMEFDFRIMDLSSLGGLTNAQVLGNVLQEVDSSGRVLFQWNAFDHFAITDIDPSIPVTAARIDWNHGNAIEIDADGNYLVSFRHLSEITKIDSRTGAVLWRLGGVRNQFEFLGDTLKFSYQHGVRRLSNGDLILFDNGNAHSPPFSRAVEYRLDEHLHTATAVWQYRPSPDLPSFALGFAQRLDNGNTLVTFGPRGAVHEVSPSAQPLWELTVPQGLWIYRAYRITSLYDPRSR